MKKFEGTFKSKGFALVDPCFVYKDKDELKGVYDALKSSHEEQYADEVVDAAKIETAEASANEFVVFETKYGDGLYRQVEVESGVIALYSNKVLNNVRKKLDNIADHGLIIRFNEYHKISYTLDLDKGYLQIDVDGLLFYNLDFNEPNSFPVFSEVYSLRFERG